MGLHDLDDPAQGGLRDERAGRVMRVRDRDEAGPGRHQRREGVRVGGPALFRLQVEDAKLRPDRPRRLEVRGVVGADHDELVARLQERGGHDEEGPRRPGGHEDVGRGQRGRVGRERAAAVGGDQLAQLRQAAVVAVAEEEPAEVDLEVVEAGVGDRALGEVAGDRVVAELLGRLDLDGHPAVAHPGMLRGGRRRRRPAGRRRRRGRRPGEPGKGRPRRPRWPAASRPSIPSSNDAGGVI